MKTFSFDRIHSSSLTMNSVPFQSELLPKAAPTAQDIVSTTSSSPGRANALQVHPDSTAGQPLKSSRKALRYLSDHNLRHCYSRAIMVGRHVLAECDDSPGEWDLYFTYYSCAEAETGVIVSNDLPAEQLRTFLEAWAAPIIAKHIEVRVADEIEETQKHFAEKAAQFASDTQVLEAEEVRNRLSSASRRGSPCRVPLQVNIPVELYMRLLKNDRKYIGTARYMGLAYFWAYEYRHSLRDISFTRRQLVHDAMLRAGLDLAGVSPEHLAIIQSNTEQ